MSCSGFGRGNDSLLVSASVLLGDTTSVVTMFCKVPTKALRCLHGRQAEPGGRCFVWLAKRTAAEFLRERGFSDTSVLVVDALGQHPCFSN
jgi:hypothetical protein